MTKKQLRARLAVLQHDASASVLIDDDNSNELNKSEHVPFSLDEVKGLISAATSGKSRGSTAISDANTPSTSDAYGAAALHLQQVVKRAKKS